MISSDLPSPAEAGFAQAGNRYPLFGIMLCVEDQPWRGAIVAQTSGDATGIAVTSVFVRINQWFGMTQLIAAE